MFRIFTLSILLLGCVASIVPAQSSAVLLRELLDLPSPPPPRVIPASDDDEKAGKERPPEFYSDENPPADDAPLADLQIIPVEKGYRPVAFWKNGGDTRLLVADELAREQNEAEIERQDKADDEDEDLHYKVKAERRQMRRAEAEYSHFSWRDFRAEKLDGQMSEPNETPYLRWRGFQIWTDGLSPNDTPWQARAGEDEIRGGRLNDKPGLFRTGRAGTARLRDGEYAHPVTTADGKWAVAEKAAGRKTPPALHRVELSSGREFTVQTPSGKYARAVMFVPAQNKVLIEIKNSDESGAPAEKHMLLDVDSGKLSEVKGDFRPLDGSTYRFQMAGRPDEVWAAIYDEKKGANICRCLRHALI